MPRAWAILEGNVTNESSDSSAPVGWLCQDYGDPAYLGDYPSLTLEAADWLLEHQVRLVALDMLSPDLPPARHAPDAQLVVYRRLLGNDVLIAENLTGLARVGRGQHRVVEAGAAPPRHVCYDACMKRTTFSLPDDMSTLLELEARRHDTSVSEIVRRALAVYFHTDEDEPRAIPFANLGASGYTTTARDHEEILRAAWGRARRR